MAFELLKWIVNVNWESNLLTMHNNAAYVYCVCVWLEG
jgi:hypothetical protein